MLAVAGQARPHAQTPPLAWLRERVVATCLIYALVGSLTASAQTSPASPMARYEVVGDAIPTPLTGIAGDAARGRDIVGNRQIGMCLLCHSGPYADAQFHGDLAPPLQGAGTRWSAGQLRLRIVDSKRANPASIMPAYHRVDGLNRVGKNWAGKPILDAQQVEDVVAYLVTLQ
jgi:sulfur-oxidizing protein SoxX